MAGTHWAAAAIVLLLILVIVWHVAGQTKPELPKAQTENLDTAGFATRVADVDKHVKKAQSTKSFMDMTEGEKVSFIIDTWFTAVSDDETPDSKIKKENDYLESLPVAGTGTRLPSGEICGNDFDDCEIWARNGECTINPEFMLYACPGACGACALTPQQKHNVTVIYNNRAPAGSVYHGQNYPGDFPYMNRLYSYNMRYT